MSTDEFCLAVTVEQLREQVKAQLWRSKPIYARGEDGMDYDTIVGYEIPPDEWRNLQRIAGHWQ